MKTELWDTLTGRPVLPPMPNVGVSVFSPDSKRIGTVADNKIRVWDTEIGNPVGDTVYNGDYTAHSMRFRPDGERIATAGKYELRVWDSKTLKPITERIRDFCAVSFPGFSSDGRRILASSSRIWDAESASH